MLHGAEKRSRNRDNNLAQKQAPIKPSEEMRYRLPPRSQWGEDVMALVAPTAGGDPEFLADAYLLPLRSRDGERLF